MNILFVTPFFLEKGPGGKDYKGISGMPMYIYRTAKALKNMGHNTMIVCGGTEEKNEVFDGVPVYRANTGSTTGWKNEILRTFEACFRGNYILQKKADKICLEKKIDIIQYAGNNGTGLFHHLKIPAVMRVSSYYKLFFSDYMTFSKRVVRWHSFFEILAIRHIGYIYCPSFVLADYLKHEAHKCIHVMETPFFDETEEKDSSVYASRLQDKKYILYYGGFEPRKGVLLIANIVERLQKKYPDHYIVFIGHDCISRKGSTLKSMRERMKNADREKIIILDELPHKSLYPIIENAEIILNPSYMENLSNACIEAMAFGKIVVGTRGASFEQLIEDGKSGFLSEIGDAESLYDSICRALELTVEERNKMQKLAKKRIRKMRPDYVLEKLLHYYEFVIRNTKNIKDYKI